MILDQQFFAHLYLPADGPDAAAAYQGLRDLWDACGLQLALTEPIPGVGLPHVLPASLDGLPADGEVAVAAIERPGADCQLILRRHHDVLALSIALAPAAARAPEDGDWVWWRRLGHQWAVLVSRHVPAPLGEARIHLARVEETPDPVGLLTPLLPTTVHDDPGDMVTTPGGLRIWETAGADDERVSRNFVLAVPPDGDAVASAWVWSRGDTAIPPLARYLLHAAKLRYELRVWRQAPKVRPAHADLRDLHRTVTIASDNLAAALGPELTGGPFHDDADLAAWFLRQLDHDMGYAETARDRRRTPEPVVEPSYDRNVFVVYGRDEDARKALFAFLRAIGLNPLEWEDLVAMTGEASPTLGQVVRTCLPMARAVVVLLTPEDVVRLHPELHGPGEPDAEVRGGMQARPNVLLEMGIAFGVNPERTVILQVGDHRPVTDLGGVNYIRVSGSPEFRQKLVNRLKTARCDVSLTGTDWLTAGDFGSLTAHHRSPEDGPGDRPAPPAP
ncbi:CATRA conflict system CASPASE/TPR repeat-associated protein [Herbidospora sp. RD11066]